MVKDKYIQLCLAHQFGGINTIEFIQTLYAIKKKKSPPHVQAHLALRASVAKELSLPHLHPNVMFIFILI